jgi:hypothetical protein
VLQVEVRLTNTFRVQVHRTLIGLLAVRRFQVILKLLDPFHKFLVPHLLWRKPLGVDLTGKEMEGSSQLDRTKP